MRIGIIGLGGVGREFLNLLEDKRAELGNQNIDIDLIFALNSSSGCLDKEGLNIPALLDHLTGTRDLSTFENGFGEWNLTHVLENVAIDYLVEATPTNKETGEPALTYIREALERGINVATANKGPVLKSYKELKRIADNKNAGFGIGCTSGGALPSISSGKYDLMGAQVTKIRGVLNGTTNYILSLMEEEGVSYDYALKKAQEAGIAEKNPSLDVEGWDTAIKMVIISNAVMNSDIELGEVSVKGIEDLTQEDINKAKLLNKRYKLVGETYFEETKPRISVGPRMLSKEDIFYGISGKNKGIQYFTDTMGDITIIGGASNIRGAAASILRDILQINMKK